MSLRACVLGLLFATSLTQAADSGVLPFPTAGSLQRSAATEPFSITPSPTTLSGELLFPEGPGPFPAVVLAHGCAGNRFVEPAWGRFLRKAGYATFNVDSLRGRNLNEVCTQPLVLTSLQRVPDAYGALRFLSAHPKIDPKRVALMGFSHGAATAMLASTTWAKENFAPAGQPSFRAFFPFYPYCNPIFPEREKIYAPVRIHTGGADDWTPAKPCADLATALKTSGQDATINVYPDALHSFDQAPGRLYRPAVSNASDCFPQMPSILGPATASDYANCLRKGATVGDSPSAFEQARKNLQAQLGELLK